MSDDPTISRRELLYGRFLGRLREEVSRRVPLPQPPAAAEPSPDAPLSARHARSFPVHRPPGAIDEEAFLAGCTRCSACALACPYDAITHAPSRYRRAAGTPMIDPVRSPCMMCPDTPCIAACEPDVLRFDWPRRMATARVDVTSCLAHRGSFCTVCSEQCPVEGAIDVVVGKPRIVEEVCTGCGVCQHVCPAPQNAILLMPLAERPAVPVTRDGVSP